jgi:antitoxin component YwqK of YwqJK toxin-antitoxin module
MKRLIIVSSFFFAIISNAKDFKVTSLDTLWYNKEFKITRKESAIIYKVNPYLINNKYIHVYFYKSTNKSHLISYSLDMTDTIYDGKRTFYYENGKVKNIVNYKNNKKEGEYVEYFENSNIAVKGTFCNDKKNGVFLQNNRKGELSGKEIWDNGIRMTRPNLYKNIAIGE